MKTGKISKTLPGVKLAAMQVLYVDYSTKDSAMMAIQNSVNEYYNSTYPDIATSRKADIDAAITEIQNGYASNIFPFMKASWKSYPNNLGHMESNGCYRCHNNRHSTTEGKVISKDCNLCHNIKAQTIGDSVFFAGPNQVLEFRHPVDIGDAWQTELCSTCHTALY